MTDQLVWIDCEMTGLDLAHDALIEIACIVTDGQLVAVDEGVDPGITLAEAQDQVLAYVREHVHESRKVPLCGNSIATDRTFIARDMPDLDAFLHYRMVDVSSVKELARRWYPRAYFASPEKHGGHRALADIKESIRELQYYREAIFVPQPGPDTATARAIAARYGTPGASGAAAAAGGAAPAGTDETTPAGEPGSE